MPIPTYQAPRFSTGSYRNDVGGYASTWASFRQARVLEIPNQGEGWVFLDWKAPNTGGKVAS
jgi:hypothetical protein